jgi:hypothetical protein
MTMLARASVDVAFDYFQLHYGRQENAPETEARYTIYKPSLRTGWIAVHRDSGYVLKAEDAPGLLRMLRDDSGRRADERNNDHRKTGE